MIVGERGWRESAWEELASRRWDLLIVGGGITGAGILREAVRSGLRAALVEARDFAWGTSSRSSKLVHGGLRYLRQGRLRLTAGAVREREALLQDAPGLVEPLGFLLAVYRPFDRLAYGAGLAFYDLIAGRRGHEYLGAAEFRLFAPHLSPRGLRGGFCYRDAQTDDARLVLRLILESAAAGAPTLNYVRAESLLLEGGSVTGVRVRDALTGRSAEGRARVVVNAAGAATDGLRAGLGGAGVVRPLRGSHLVFPADRLPAPQALAFAHPEGGPGVFVFPWEGVTVVGTTDLDHSGPPQQEPRMEYGEAERLVSALQTRMPGLDLTLEDAICGWAGVRPVVGRGRGDPTRESREDLILDESGLLSVAGGKLTTFRLTARRVLARVRERIPELELPSGSAPVFDTPDPNTLDRSGLEPEVGRRLLGRYGREAVALVRAAGQDELERIPGTRTLWAELRWAARAECVEHLEDLLLRRTRLGVLLPEGGAALLPRVRGICRDELGWNDRRWEREAAAYRELWESAYRVPEPHRWRARPKARVG
jgi:glycerol-3-phosphate dehydrogenase